MSDTIEKLAEDHWSYVERLLVVHDEAPDVIEKCKHHYITAMCHGWKHAMEERAEESRDAAVVKSLRAQIRDGDGV